MKHDDCLHPRTSTARAACRKRRARIAQEVAEYVCPTDTMALAYVNAGHTMTCAWNVWDSYRSMTEATSDEAAAIAVELLTTDPELAQDLGCTHDCPTREM